VLVLAATKQQATVIFNYALAFIESSPMLRSQIQSVTAEEIRLSGNVVIGVLPNNYRTVRGRTLLACIFDECAFWRDETSAKPDLETKNELGWRGTNKRALSAFSTSIRISRPTRFSRAFARSGRLRSRLIQAWLRHTVAGACLAG
jgi:hypothetical protein